MVGSIIASKRYRGVGEEILDDMVEEVDPELADDFKAGDSSASHYDVREEHPQATLGQ